MKKIILKDCQLDNEQSVEQDEDGEYSICDFTSSEGDQSWALKTETYVEESPGVFDKEINFDYPHIIIEKSDLKTQKDRKIFKMLFRCIWETDNGITNYIDFNNQGVCEINEDFTRKDFVDFIDKFPCLKDVLFLDEEEYIGVSISFLLYVDRKTIFNL